MNSRSMIAAFLSAVNPSTFDQSCPIGEPDAVRADALPLRTFLVGVEGDLGALRLVPDFAGEVVLLRAGAALIGGEGLRGGVPTSLVSSSA